MALYPDGYSLLSGLNCAIGAWSHYHSPRGGSGTLRLGCSQWDWRLIWDGYRERTGELPFGPWWSGLKNAQSICDYIGPIIWACSSVCVLFSGRVLHAIRGIISEGLTVCFSSRRSGFSGKSTFVLGCCFLRLSVHYAINPVILLLSEELPLRSQSRNFSCPFSCTKWHLSHLQLNALLGN